MFFIIPTLIDFLVYEELTELDNDPATLSKI